MIRRKLFYLAALVGSLVFYWAYREWMSWIFLMILLLLPWFSLLMSLPAILYCKATIICPNWVDKGAVTPLSWQFHSPYPLWGMTSKLSATNLLNGQHFRLRKGNQLPTAHCGLLTITLRNPRCYDYLGLFALPVRKKESAKVLVRPLPIPPQAVPDMRRYRLHMWQPKPGGGYSENHELRLYRPGDNLRQVHWKLSAKTGTLITREAMQPIRSRMLLTMELQGNPEQLDTKLGRLLWMSRYLLECQLPHSIQCLTGNGIIHFHITCSEDVDRAITSLLQSPPAKEGSPIYNTANWRYHIGGNANE